MTKLIRIGCLTLLSLVISAAGSRLSALPGDRVVFAQEAAPKPAAGGEDDGMVIEPGKEEVLGVMLGQKGGLPGDCTFEGGQIERTLVKSTYKCPGGDVVLQILHPSKATNPVAKTAKFAITVLSGTPPAGLVDEVSARMRAHEGEFDWKVIERKVPPAASSRITLLVAVGAVVVVILGLVLRRRSSASKA